MAFGIFKKAAKLVTKPIGWAVKASLLPVKAAADLLGIGGKKSSADPVDLADPMDSGPIGADPGAISDISAPPMLSPEASVDRMAAAVAAQRGEASDSIPKSAAEADAQRRRQAGGLISTIQGGALGLFTSRQEKLRARLGGGGA